MHLLELVSQRKSCSLSYITAAQSLTDRVCYSLWLAGVARSAHQDQVRPGPGAPFSCSSSGACPVHVMRHLRTINQQRLVASAYRCSCHKFLSGLCCQVHHSTHACLHLVSGAGQICKSGRCQCVSPKEIMCTSGTCVDIKSDNNNCGACGAVCTAGEPCCHTPMLHVQRHSMTHS
jgi:hypothetical protein